MWKRWMWWVCGLMAVMLFMNYATESIPVRFSSSISADSEFSVLCYNVKCSDVGYRENQIDIANMIIKESPDVVYLCEFNRSVSKGLDSLMINQGGYKSIYKKGANCIFYSKYDLDSIIGINTGTSCGKKALNNLVYAKIPQGLITFIGCHFSSSGAGIVASYRGRKEEADSIYKVCMKEARPLIVLGDMNDISGSYPINRIKEAGLKDAWWEGGRGYGATFQAGLLKLRIDHILYDYEGLELVEVKVIDNDLSDHNALMARFKIRNNYIKNNINKLK